MDKLKLLVPLDGTSFSRKIQPEVSRLFPSDRFDLHLVHVARLPVAVADAMHQPALVGPDATLYAYGVGSPNPQLHPMYDEESLEEYRSSLLQELEAEEAVFEEQGYDVTTTVHFGEPALEIAKYAREENADVIAMATHGRSGFGRMLLGSVAKDVLDRVDRPVLMLRAVDDRRGGDEENGEESDDEAGGAGDREHARNADPHNPDRGRGHTEERAGELAAGHPEPRRAETSRP